MHRAAIMKGLEFREHSPLLTWSAVIDSLPYTAVEAFAQESVAAKVEGIHRVAALARS